MVPQPQGQTRLGSQLSAHLGDPGVPAASEHRADVDMPSTVMEGAGCRQPPAPNGTTCPPSPALCRSGPRSPSVLRVLCLLWPSPRYFSEFSCHWCVDMVPGSILSSGVWERRGTLHLEGIQCA